MDYQGRAALRIAENMEGSLGVPTATSQRQIAIKLLDENRRLVNDSLAGGDLPDDCAIVVIKRTDP